MNKKDLKIIFFGTPDFAVASLKALIDNEFNVVAVVTALDKPAGRGHQLKSSEVKIYAKQSGLQVLEPSNLKSPEFIEQLNILNADIQVVVAFRMLPEMVWNKPPLGTINVHGSLLPKYRGAAPIHWAVIHGEEETGVTTFRLKHEIDTGGILKQAKYQIKPHDTTGEVYHELMQLGADLLIETLQDIIEDRCIEVQQEEALVSHAPKIFKEDAFIDFSKSPKEIFNLVRGMNPFPGAYMQIEGKSLKIFKTEYIFMVHSHPLGTYEIENDELKVYCSGGYITPLDVQLEGKKRMFVQDFLRGWKL